jgi:hypothetical protein
MAHTIPKASIDSLNEVVAGYNKIADAGEEIDDEKVAETRDVTTDVARRQKRFFAEIGVLEKDGHDYTLTERGDELGEMNRFNQKDEAMAIYADLLENWEPTAEIVAHAGEDGIEHDDLIDKVALATSTDLTTARKKTGAGATIDLLVEAGFLDEDSGTYFAADTSGSDGPSDAVEPSVQPTSEPEVLSSGPTSQGAPGGSGGVQTAAARPPSGGIDISLDIDGGDDPENVRDLLVAIREGTESDLDELANGDE